MIKQFILAALALVSVACSHDPRTAEVRVDDARLQYSVERASMHWADATGGDVALHFTGECTSDACIHVVVDPALNGTSEKARTRRDDTDPMQYTALIRVSEDVFNDDIVLGDNIEDIISIITHELGHVFWLEHTDDLETERDDAEIMTSHDFGNPVGHACIGPETCRQYKDKYDSQCNVTCW